MYGTIGKDDGRALINLATMKTTWRTVLPGPDGLICHHGVATMSPARLIARSDASRKLRESVHLPLNGGLIGTLKRDFSRGPNPTIVSTSSPLANQSGTDTDRETSYCLQPFLALHNISHCLHPPHCSTPIRAPFVQWVLKSTALIMRRLQVSKRKFLIYAHKVSSLAPCRIALGVPNICKLEARSYIVWTGRISMSGALSR